MSMSLTSLSENGRQADRPPLNLTLSGTGRIKVLYVYEKRLRVKKHHLDLEGPGRNVEACLRRSNFSWQIEILIAWRSRPSSVLAEPGCLGNSKLTCFS